MDTDSNNTTTNTLLSLEQVEELSQQFRAACLAALDAGKPLDSEAILRALFHTRGAQPDEKTEVLPVTETCTPSRDDSTPAPQRDAGVATIAVSPGLNTHPEEDPADQGATRDYASAPIDPNATQDLPGQRKSSSSLFGGSPSARGGVPESFAGYEILGVLGKGGMGVVYKARQRGLKRIVALKMIRRQDADDQDLARFRIEAEAVAQLQHPNIVQVYEVGEDAGRPFLSLEYIDGGSLKDKLHGKPQPVLHAAQLVQLLAYAMGAAHRQGIVHRDLKPANVMLMGRREGSTELRSDTTVLVEELYGTPKIADFGLAKRLEEDDGQTRSGTVLGTPSYMAPEQAQGHVKEVGPLADQYALGAVLYELLTGRPPFVGATILETLEQVRSREPLPPTRLQPKVPRDLETICLKCLQKDPQKRYADCTALAEDLRRFVAGDPILARPVSVAEQLWRWCRRNPRVAALSASVLLLLIVVLAGSVVFNFWLSEAKAQTEKEKQNAVEAQLLAEQKETDAKEQRQVALDSLGDIIFNVADAVGQLGGQQELQKQLLGIAMRSVQRISLNPKAKISLNDSTLAAAHWMMGKVLEQLGELEKADEEYRLADDAYVKQLAADPDNAKCRANHVLALMALGRINLQRRGHVLEARDFFSKANALLATADQNRGEGQLPLWQVKKLRAQAVHWLGVFVVASNPRLAREHYQRSLELYEETAALLHREGTAALVGLLGSPLGQDPLVTVAVARVLQRELDNAEREIVQSYFYMGGIELKLHNVAETQELYRKGIQISQALADAYPNDLGGLLTLADGRERLGDLYLRSRQPTLAFPEHEQAARILQRLVDHDPNRADRKTVLARLLYSLGIAAVQLGKQDVAVEKFGASLKLRQVLTRGQEGAPQYGDYLATLARCGDYQKAAEMARRLREHSDKDANSLLDVACCFAICSGVVAPNQRAADLTPEQRQLRADFAGQAIEALQTAVGLGYRDVYNLETEPDLDAVREVPEFKALLDQLRRAAVK
jgi:serine/threonine protein kinase